MKESEMGVSQSPPITVVVPCHNMGQYLDDALDSIAEQTSPGWRVVVVDDGSTDEATLARLQTIDRPDVRVIHRPKGGVAAARNTGIEATDSPYICCLDADDRVAPDFFEEGLAVLQAEPNIGFISGWLRTFGARSETIKLEAVGLPDLLVSNGVVVPAIFRRSAWERVGGYRGTFTHPGIEDWDFWISLTEAGFEGRVLPEVVWEYRIHPGQMSEEMYRPATYGKLLHELVLCHQDTYRKHWPFVISRLGQRWAELKQWADELTAARDWMKDQASESRQLEDARAAELVLLKAKLSEQESALQQLRKDRDADRRELAEIENTLAWVHSAQSSFGPAQVRLQVLDDRRRALATRSGTQTRQDPENEWIAAYVKGMTFADVGGLWQTANEKVSVALKAGAASAALVDITPLDSPPWQHLHDRMSSLGVSTYRCIQADLNDLLTIPALPQFDVVYCSGVLYHSPNSQVLMAALSRLTRRVLILGTAVIPPMISGGRHRLATTPGEARFVPELDDTQKAIVTRYFREVGAGVMVGLNAPTNWDPDDYDAWWWLFTREYVEAMLRVAGFEIVETGSAWGGRTALFLATK